MRKSKEKPLAVGAFFGAGDGIPRGAGDVPTPLVGVFTDTVVGSTPMSVG